MTNPQQAKYQYYIELFANQILSMYVFLALF